MRLAVKKDIEAIESVIHCGCIVIGTVHGADVKELYQKPELGALLKPGGIWQIDCIIR